MSIRKETKHVYTSDRGDEFILKDMEDHHILNVLRLHREQRDTLESELQYAVQEKQIEEQQRLFVKKRIADLEDMIVELFQELASRNPDEPEHIRD